MASIAFIMNVDGQCNPGCFFLVTDISKHSEVMALLAVRGYYFVDANLYLQSG